MRSTTDEISLAGAAALTVLTGGLLLLPLGLAFLWTLLQRQEELKRGELDDAKTY